MVRLLGAVVVLLLVSGCSRKEEVTATNGYVDTRICAGCHPAVAKTHWQTGMGRSFATMRLNSPRIGLKTA